MLTLEQAVVLLATLGHQNRLGRRFKHGFAADIDRGGLELGLFDLDDLGPCWGAAGWGRPGSTKASAWACTTSPMTTCRVSGSVILTSNRRLRSCSLYSCAGPSSDGWWDQSMEVGNREDRREKRIVSPPDSLSSRLSAPLPSHIRCIECGANFPTHQKGASVQRPPLFLRLSRDAASKGPSVRTTKPSRTAAKTAVRKESFVMCYNGNCFVGEEN